MLVTETGIPLITTQGTATLTFEQSSSGVDLSVSRDGGVTFGSSVRQNMNATGLRKSLFIYRQLGRVNDCTYQFRFWGLQRFVISNGIAEIYE